MGKVPAKVAARISKNYNTMKKIVLNAGERDINEADTVVIVSDILADVYGYDKYKEITREFAIRNTYVDLAIQLNETPELLIEVKAIGIELNDKHIKQAVDYGANKGIDWVVLTNAKTWKVYKLRFEKPVSAELIFQFDFVDLNPRKQEDLEKLFILCKEGIQKNAILEFSNYRQVVNKYFIGSILQYDGVINLVRRELNRMLPKNSVTADEVLMIIQNGVLKREMIESDEVEVANANYKKLKRKTHSKKPQHSTSKKEPQSDEGKDLEAAKV
jgi:hypothetical protein